MLGRTPPRLSVRFLENSKVYSFPASSWIEKTLAASVCERSCFSQIIEGAVTAFSTADRRGVAPEILTEGAEVELSTWT